MSDEAAEASSSGDDAEAGRPALAEQRETDSVYAPAEDSHLLARTIRDAVGGNDRVLDVGTGSGYVARALLDHSQFVVGVDVNPHACRQAREAGVPVVRGDLVSPFADDAFDLVVCNPPYLPTPADREWDDWMEAALSGGEDGRRLVDPLLERVGRVLAPGGRLFVLISSLTGIDDVLTHARDQGLDGSVVASEKDPYERLVVLEFCQQ